jgi:hypothetical protein
MILQINTVKLSDSIFPMLQPFTAFRENFGMPIKI